GTRCVVAYGGAAKPALEQAFVEDIELLRSVGLQPIVVRADNAHLVQLLNLDGARAVGISGKDAGLFRVKGDELAVHAPLVETLLGQGYIPVIAPLALGDDGRPREVELGAAAAQLAVALAAHKLIYVTDAPGI